SSAWSRRSPAVRSRSPRPRRSRNDGPVSRPGPSGRSYSSSGGAVSTPAQDARLESLGEGRFRVSGTLDARTVGRLLEEGAASFDNGASVEVDLGGVTESDSAGLALLIEWLRAARRRG